MIEKKIHYIWFGGKPLPELAEKCIRSWQRYCPDYEIVRWDENNFDVNCNRYCREAYIRKKWAFVSDYARLWVLVNHGGIYMDTDVEVIKPIDDLLENKAFSGFENEVDIPTGIMACEKGFPLFAELLAEYETRSFIDSNGNADMTTNVTSITNACLKRGFIQNNEYQIIDGFSIYPKDWFCPKSYKTGLICCTDNTRTIHHFSGSWLSEEDRAVADLTHGILRSHPRLPVKIGKLISIIKYCIQTKNFKYIKSKIENR